MTGTTCTTCGNPTGRALARFCDACRWPRRLKRKKYQWTTEKDAYLRQSYDATVPGRARQIAELWGWPRWAVTKRAQQLGLARTREDYWSTEDTAKVEQWAGTRHPHWIAKQLGRTETAVVVKIKRLGMSRLPEGYSQSDVAFAFGVSRDTVERWIRRGWLVSRFQPIEGQPYRFTDGEVLAFVSAHPQAFVLAKVDQVWFMDLVCGAGRKDLNKVA